MPRGKKQTEGQISFDFCMNTENYVVQANKLIGGRQALKLNSAKLIRSAIMQIVRDDEELKPYIITIKELADLLGVPTSNIYRDVEDITDDIISNPVYVREEMHGRTIKFIKIPWVSRCEYCADIGVALQLNDALKPFLLNLKERYTQYTLQEVLAMKSVYAIRIFEMLLSRIMSRTLPKNGIQVVLSVQEIRECCNCEEKYPAFGNFKNKVIDKAINEIHRVTTFRVRYSYIKRGRNVIAIEFDVNSCYHM